MKRFLLWIWGLMFVYLAYAITYIVVRKYIKKSKENN